jgi:two-component system chemotaxis sensor kinase CheA
MDEIEIDRELLLQTFLAEAEEKLANMEQVFVALESRPGDDALLNAVFRDAHTLKGGAGLVAFEPVRELAHDVENVLERLRQRTLGVTDALVTLLLKSVDVLRAAISDCAGGAQEASEATREFQRRLADAATATSTPTSTPTSTSTSTPTAAPAPTASQSSGLRSLRVDVAKLDRMLDLSGEIAIARGRLGELLERGEASHADLLEAHREAERLHLDLQELIMKARMVPIGPSFHQHLRTLRDVATPQGKIARLVVEGEDVEVDTAVVELLRDPLGHMVRNAIDHGLERPDVRRAAGKNPVGTVSLRAYHETGSMVIEVADDGAGLDRLRIAERGAAMGLVDDPAHVDDEALARLVFEPGFSTAEKVTEISGRGVGMDVVRRNVEALRGTVSLRSEPGRGTTVTVRVPLTLAIIQGFRVGLAQDDYILPLDAVVECVELPADAPGDCCTLIPLRGKPLPALRLRDHFRLAGPRPERENVVVVQHGPALAGLVVDALHGESSTVIKPLGALFRGLPGVAGSSILGDGRVALVLDVAGLLREALRRAAA